MTLAAFALVLLSASADEAVTFLGEKPKGPVRRVVTASPALTDAVLELGNASVLVGVSRFDERVEVKDLPRVGGFNDPSLEVIVRLRPDVVLLARAPSNQPRAEALAARGIYVVAARLKSVRDVKEAMKALGALLDAKAKAEAWERAFLATSPRGVSDAGSRPRALVVVGFKPLVVAGPGSFVHELLMEAGADNLAEEAPTGYPLYSLERALRLAPDIVIDASDSVEGRDRVHALPGFSKARWVTLRSKALLRPGPALSQAFDELVEALAAAAHVDERAP